MQQSLPSARLPSPHTCQLHTSLLPPACKLPSSPYTRPQHAQHGHACHSMGLHGPGLTSASFSISGMWRGQAAQQCHGICTSAAQRSQLGSQSGAVDRTTIQPHRPHVQKRRGVWAAAVDDAVEPDTVAHAADKPYQPFPLSAEQRHILNSEARFKLIRAVAGSGKTETLVQIAMKHVARRQNVLFVTKVGSVTEEIKARLEQQLPGALSCGPVKFKKYRAHMGSVPSNHWLWEGKSATIEVSNLDAMVHTQLQQHKDPLLYNRGACFDQKVERLTRQYIETDQHKTFVLVNGQAADVLLVDEVQDFDAPRVAMMAGVLQRNIDLLGTACGDYLQTVFSDSVDRQTSQHCMDLLVNLPGTEQFDMDICYRCPKSHVALANSVTNAYHSMHSTVPMQAHHGDPPNTRPILFAHPKTSKNFGAETTAKQVVTIIQAYFEMDPDLRPDDVAVIAPFVNNNAVFGMLEYELNATVLRGGGSRGPGVHLFKTKDAIGITPIDWGLAQGKVALLSIHGDKGRGHKMVIVLDASGNLPSSSRIGKPEEIIDLSVLNVALTRSTRYLVVGFADGSPSPYLYPAMKHLPGVVQSVSWKDAVAAGGSSSSSAAQPASAAAVRSAGQSGLGLIQESTSSNGNSTQLKKRKSREVAPSSLAEGTAFSSAGSGSGSSSSSSSSRLKGGKKSKLDEYKQLLADYESQRGKVLGVRDSSEGSGRRKVVLKSAPPAHPADAVVRMRKGNDSSLPSVDDDSSGGSTVAWDDLLHAAAVKVPPAAPKTKRSRSSKPEDATAAAPAPAPAVDAAAGADIMPATDAVQPLRKAVGVRKLSSIRPRKHIMSALPAAPAGRLRDGGGPLSRHGMHVLAVSVMDDFDSEQEQDGLADDDNDVGLDGVAAGVAVMGSRSAMVVQQQGVMASWMWASEPAGSFYHDLGKAILEVQYAPQPADKVIDMAMPAVEHKCFKQRLRVSTDIAHCVQHPSDLLSGWRDRELTKSTFGRPFSLLGELYQSLRGSSSGFSSASTRGKGGRQRRKDDGNLLNLSSSSSSTTTHSSSGSSSGSSNSSAGEVSSAIYPVLGEFGELCVERTARQGQGDMESLHENFGYLAAGNAGNAHVYVQESNQTLLNLVQDYGLNDHLRHGNTKRYFSGLQGLITDLEVAEERQRAAKGNRRQFTGGSGVLSVSPLMAELQVLAAQPEPCYVLPSFCKELVFQDALSQFLSDTPTHKLPAQSMWQVAIAQALLHEPIRRPMLQHCRWSVSEPGYQKLCYNASALLDHVDLKGHELEFQTEHALSAHSKDHGLVGIFGRSDIIIPETSHVLEIKCPVGSCNERNGYRDVWMIQALGYQTIAKTALSRTSVVNLPGGRLFSYGSAPPNLRQRMTFVKLALDEFRWSQKERGPLTAELYSRWLPLGGGVKGSDVSMAKT